MVPFQEVLSQVRKMLQEAHLDLLPTFLTELLEAQVFSAQFYQSVFQCVDPDPGNSTDVEDLARRLALPIWQKWDVSQEILVSALGNIEDSLPDAEGMLFNVFGVFDGMVMWFQIWFLICHIFSLFSS